MKKMNRSLLLLLSILLMAASLPAQGKVQKRFTILGLGDSVTEGGENFISYLYPLWVKLFQAGYEFEFIGPRSTAVPFGPIQHYGNSGKNVEFLEKNIAEVYRKYPADIVLLHAGHNHFVEEQPVPHMIETYESIIEKMTAINPDVKILLAKVINSGKLPKYSYIGELNQEIEKMVKRHHYKQVTLVDQNTGFDWKKYTIEDKVHPNRAGAHRMADVWYQSLKKVLDRPAYHFDYKEIPYKVLGEGDTLHLHYFKAKHHRQPAPTLVYFFGGGWKYGTPLQFYRECQYFAERGMNTVTVDYRTHHSHHTDPFASLEDAKDAMRFLRDHAEEYHIDPDHIATAGGSAGGHLAAAMGTLPEDEGKTSFRSNLLVLYYPVVDNGPEGYGYQYVKERYREFSPQHNVSSTTPPVLFIYGTNDRLVTSKMVSNFQKELERHNVPNRFISFKGCGHPIFLYRKPLNSVYYDILKITDDYLFEHHYLKRPRKK